MPTHTNDNSVRHAMYWAIAAFGLALAVRANDGTYDVWGMAWLSLAIAAALGGVLTIAGPLKMVGSQAALNWLLGACIAAFAALTMVPVNASFPLVFFFGCFLVCGLVGILVGKVAGKGIVRRVLFPLFLCLNAGLGTMTVLGSRSEEKGTDRFTFQVRNDVQYFADEAAKSLLAGKSPYSEHMLNVMGADLPFYPAGATDKNGRLPFGYPYMPLTALLSVPAYLLGDIRFANVFALIGAALLLGYARPSVTAQLAASAFLVFPSTLLVLSMSWTEPVPVFFLAATLFCYFRAPKLLYLALGCLVASKQYTLFMLPLLPLFVPDKAHWKPLLWKSLGVAAFLTLPMALWDVPGFYRSVVQMQFKQPFREDSLSYFVTVIKMGGAHLSPLIGFAALIGGIWLGLKRAPRGAAGWCAAGAVAYLGFFALNKQAFANYYFWIFGLLIAAVAVAFPAEDGAKKREIFEPKPGIR